MRHVVLALLVMLLHCSGQAQGQTMPSACADSLLIVLAISGYGRLLA
jgi:hypothetical protein